MIVQILSGIHCEQLFFSNKVKPSLTWIWPQDHLKKICQAPVLPFELSAIFDNILLFALQLSTLADLCIGILPLMLTTENVCPILKFSYKWRLHLHHTIHECALLFFFKNQEEIEQNFPEPLQEVWDILNPSKSACG